MTEKQGVFTAQKKDGTVYFRSSVTYKGKHISLGSFDTEDEASRAYFVASEILRDESAARFAVEDHEKEGHPLSFDKWIMLLNLRRTGIYCRNPIILEHKYFLYYLDKTTILKFDVDDLFYYMNHKIMRRGGRLFVADYGMQVGVLSRYGIKNFAVKDRDYRFRNGDETDLRYSNIEIINRYFGVYRSGTEGRYVYTAKVHLNGDNIIGKYKDEVEAAIAYNKATDMLTKQGFTRPFYKNYIEDLSSEEYHIAYSCVSVNKKIASIRPDTV